jgi:pilus assembly protein CpaC
MAQMTKIIRTKITWCLFLSILFSWPCIAGASGAVVEVDAPSQKLHLTSGKSIVLRSGEPVKRISIAKPEIADFVLLSPREIYLTGKVAGTTNLIMWKNGDVAAIYDLEVGYDLSTLKQQLHELLPDETGLKVFRMNDTITLSGTISNAARLSQAVALAKTFAPEERVTNLTQVGGGHQVMLEVRVAEMTKATTKRLGINFNYANGAEFGLSLLGGLSQLVSPDDANIGSPTPDFWLNIPPSVQAISRFNTGDVTWTGFIDALQQDGLVKVLAKPTLISMSGQQANFLAGGEFPVPVPQGLGTVAIEYKAFGVALNFTPVVLSNERINIQVTPEVSELDFSTAIQFSGFVIPGLSSRRATTTIELGDGQSFAIAGLLKENVRDVLRKFPLLGNIPILGALFRSREFQKSETELVIIVTPRLVKPLNMAEASLPTDYYVEPGDAEIYIEGVLQDRLHEPETGASAGVNRSVPASLAGQFGHTLPGEE